MATQKEKNNEEEVKNKKSTKKKTKEVSESSKSAPKAETAKIASVWSTQYLRFIYSIVFQTKAWGISTSLGCPVDPEVIII